MGAKFLGIGFGVGTYNQGTAGYIDNVALSYKEYSVSYDFEEAVEPPTKPPPEDGIVVFDCRGPMSKTKGWAGATNNGGMPDFYPSVSNWCPGIDRNVGDAIVSNEEIAYAGSSYWNLKRGYDSPVRIPKE